MEECVLLYNNQDFKMMYYVSFYIEASMLNLQKSFFIISSPPSLLCKEQKKKFPCTKINIFLTMSYFYDRVATQNRQNIHKINTMALLYVIDS